MWIGWGTGLAGYFLSSCLAECVHQISSSKSVHRADTSPYRTTADLNKKRLPIIRLSNTWVHKPCVIYQFLINLWNPLNRYWCLCFTWPKCWSGYFAERRLSNSFVVGNQIQCPLRECCHCRRNKKTNTVKATDGSIQALKTKTITAERWSCIH